MKSESGVYRKGMLRRLETWIIIVMVIAIVLIILSGCAPSECSRTGSTECKQKPKPEPSPVFRRFDIGDVNVAEFRDSAGRVCVTASYGSYDGRGGRALVLDCAVPALPPLDYEDLPEKPGNL